MMINNQQSEFNMEDMDQLQYDQYSKDLLSALDIESKGYVLKDEILQIIDEQGVQFHGELKTLINFLNECFDEEPLYITQMQELLIQNTFLRKILDASIIIPNFISLKNNIKQGYQKILKEPLEGKIYREYPRLQNANPNLFGVGFCSIDGQIYNVGDHRSKFHISQVGRILAYAYLYEIIGEEIHQWVGEEPSGSFRDAQIFDQNGKPHNPIVDSGGLIVCALIIREGKSINDIVNFYKRITLSKKIEIDFELSAQWEIMCNSDAAITNLMLAQGIFPTYDCYQKTMEKTIQAGVLFRNIQCMLIEVESLILFGGCLANNGKNILNQEQIISPQAVHAINPLIMTCGMLHRVGYFLENFGLPTISGFSGNTLSIVPGLGALVTFSPLLDQYQVSIRGMKFIQYLSGEYSDFNMFCKDTQKQSLTDFFYQKQINFIIQARKATYYGDIDNLKILIHQGLDINEPDYDRSTILHIATHIGNYRIVKWLVKNKANINTQDRWGFTPLDLALDEKVQNYLQKMGGQNNNLDQKIGNYQRPNENENFDRLMLAIKYNQMRIIQTLRITNWHVQESDHMGRSPLHLAASEGNLEILNYLINNGANIQAVDILGNDCLKDAKREKQYHIINQIQQMND